LVWGVALLLPLLLYGWLPLRAAMGVRDLHGSYVHSWAGFWDHVLARQYTGFFADNPLAVARTGWDWLQIWQAQTGWAGLGLGVLGMAWLLQSSAKLRLAWLLVALVLAVNLLFALNYRVHDAPVFLLPALLAGALWTGAGVAWLGGQLQRWPVLAVAVQALCVVALALGVGGRGPWVNRNGDWAAHDYAVALAKVDFPPGSQVIALEGEATALRYMQQAAGLGQNATPVVADAPEERLQILETLVAAGAPVYLTRELAGIAGRYSFSGAGPLIRVWPRGQAQVSPPTHPVDVAMADGRLRLEGYDLVKLHQAGGPVAQLALYWRPVAPITETFKLSLRLHGEEDAPLVGGDGQSVQVDHFPLRLVAQTPDWVTGELIRDVYDLPLPPAALGQPIRLLVIVYEAATVAEVGRWALEVTF
jgi:hypothetical protein